MTRHHWRGTRGPRHGLGPCAYHPEPCSSPVVEPFTLTVERPLPARAEAAYAWLTDYEPADAERAGAVIAAREVLEEEEDRIVLVERVRSIGIEREVRTIVELDPPHRWQATMHGADTGNPDVVTYQLDPIDETRSHLSVTYAYGLDGYLEKAMVWLLSPLMKREVRKMWDGFEAAMRRELARV